MQLLNRLPKIYQKFRFLHDCTSLKLNDCLLKFHSFGMHRDLLPSIFDDQFHQNIQIVTNNKKSSKLKGKQSYKSIKDISKQQYLQPPYLFRFRFDQFSQTEVSPQQLYASTQTTLETVDRSVFCECYLRMADYLQRPTKYRDNIVKFNLQYLSQHKMSIGCMVVECLRLQVKILTFTFVITLMNYIQLRSSFYIILIAILTHSCTCSTNTETDNQTVAIQSTNQTFFTYIPYSSDCNYPYNVEISLGEIKYTLLDAANIFGSIWSMGEIVFWGGLVDGIRMLANSQELLQNGAYNQIVLFNSTISPNHTQRQLILASINSPQILFTYAEPIYNSTDNTLTPNIVSQLSYSFNQDIEQIISSCPPSSLVFTYIGNQTYLGLCANTTQIFAWNSSNSSISFVFTDLSFLNGQNIQNMTSNPYLLVPNLTLNTTAQDSLSYWNAVFLTQGATIAFFCSVNISSISCENYQKEQLWVEMVIQGGWGIETTGQLSQIQLILSLFPEITNYTFPGTIVSVFSYESTIFVESQSNNTSYLSIFTETQQLANTTIKGTIIYYGEQNLLVQDSESNFWIADFILPLYYIPNTTLQTSSTLYINCSYTQYQLNYQIIWTSANYPQYQIQSTNNSTQVSYQGTFVQNLNDDYLVIGPAFSVFITQTEDIDISLLDISQMLTIEGLISVVDIIFISQNSKVNWLPYQTIFLDLLGFVKKYSFATQQIYTMPQPCSFPTLTASFKLKNTLLFIGNGNVCTCDNTLNNCQVVKPQQLPSIVLQNANSLLQYSLTLTQIHKALGLPASNPNQLKKQIANLASSDLLVNIYENNTIILTNLQGKYIVSIQSECTEYNSTDGTIFPRNFYDDYLIIYCYNTPTITQYLIRNEQLVYNRDIPIYGFITTSRQNSILSGQNYIFLQVDLDPQYQGIFQSRTNASSCCILRLDPDQFTVSVIAQIILANTLIAVESMYSIDIVFYNQTTMSQSSPFIKVYFDSTWLTFKQTTICTPLNLTCPPVTYNYGISYISDFYNFAGIFIKNITFDISASKITVTGPSIQDIQLYRYQANYTIYNNTVLYNFNNFCGPISQFYQTNVINLEGNLFSITENKIVISNKQITSNYSAILQIIDIADYAPNNTLSSCLLIVGFSNLTFYVKYDGSWMQTSYVVKIKQSNCFFFVNRIVDQYSVQFGSYCFHLQVNTPLILVTYNPALAIPFNATCSTMNLPLQLRSISSILTLNETYLIGLEQGPSKSITGVLNLCKTTCNLLTINTQVLFFIDYDQQVTQEGLLVVSLDIQTLNFWINPNLLPFNNISITADYTINYQQQIGSFCSKVKIVYGSFTTPNLILSCGTFYQQITVNFKLQTIDLGLKFTKFANCEQIDRFKPEFILEANTRANIQLLAVECQQTVSTVRIQQLSSQSSSPPQNIVTAYLLIYTRLGPRCSYSNWYPIRIINLGISGQFMLYNIYYSNQQWKLIYQKINGILIDSFIEMVPQVNYELIEMTRTITYPVISMTINNPYYSLAMTIQTHSPKQSVPIVYFYTSLGIFISFNIITLFFLFCWCFMNRPQRRHPKTKYYSNRQTLITNSSKSHSSKLFKSDKQSIYQNSSISREKPSMNQEMELGVVNIVIKPEPKRKGTEIELFQPR